VARAANMRLSRCGELKLSNKFSSGSETVLMQFRTVNFLPRFPGALKNTHRMKNKEPQKALPSPVLTIIVQPNARHVCLYPAKEKPGTANPVPAPPPTKQEVAAEVGPRGDNAVGTFTLGLLAGLALDAFLDRYEK